MVKYKQGKNPNSHIQSKESNLKRSLKLKGVSKSDEHRKNISLGQIGKKFSKETRRKMSEWQIGKIVSKETRLKMSLSQRGRIPWNKGKKNMFSKTSKKKMSISHQKRKQELGYINSPETRKKLRLKTIDYIKKVKSDIHPMIGRNENQILNEIELSNKYEILRQYHIKKLGYWVDGYMPELNLVIEVDERIKDNEKDIRRENEIKEELNCLFIRIEDNF
jgi:hypothetical protein